MALRTYLGREHSDGDDGCSSQTPGEYLCAQAYPSRKRSTSLALADSFGLQPPPFAMQHRYARHSVGHGSQKSEVITYQSLHRLVRHVPSPLAWLGVAIA